MVTYDNNMTGPLTTAVDLGNYYAISGNRTTACKIYSLEKKPSFTGHLFYNALEWYRLYGNSSDLSTAITGAYTTIADHYRYTDFWKFMEIYEETGDPNFLTEATKAGYEFLTSLNVNPRVFDENILVDEFDQAPIHFGTPGRHVLWGFDPPLPMYAPEQTVPTWRPALTGLFPMAYRAFTFIEYPGGLTRLAWYANDDLMRTMARWAIVGRWANYPGQQFSRTHSLVYEQDDFCMHPLEYMTFTSMHLWHHWQYIPWTIDFMVNEAITRSEGNIDFPSRRLFDGGAGGRINIWGDRPGSFYGDDDVRLWIPNNLLTLGSQQINYIAGYGNGNLYLALSNESASALSNVSLSVSSSKVSYGSSHTIKVWKNNVAQSDKTLSNGTVNVDIPAKGLTALIIEGVDAITSRVHTNLFKPAYTLTDKSLVRDTTTESYGSMIGMILSFGPELTEAYTYTDARPSYSQNIAGDTNNVKMIYRLDGGSWLSTAVDHKFPFEFSVQISPDINTFEYKYEERNDNNVLTTLSVYTLIVTPYHASKPSPAHEAHAKSTADLSWKAGYYAASHNVYFGTSESAVTTATTASSVYKGNQTGKTYDPGALTAGVTYYWRIDEVNAGDSNSPWKGAVWNFRVENMIDPNSLTATAINNYLNRDPVYAVNSAGMSGDAHASDTPVYKMWMGANGTWPKWFKVDLGSSTSMDFMRIWNFNWTGYTTRGCQGVNLYYSNSGSDPGNPVDNPGNWTAIGSAFDLHSAGCE